MKLYLISIVAGLALALCEAQADTELRKRSHQNGGGRGGGGGGRHGGGGGGNLAERLEAMVETQCDPTTCEGVTLTEDDCTSQQLQNPPRPDTSEMDRDARARAKNEYRAAKKDCKQNMFKCACCAGMSIEDILAARGDAGGSRPHGGGGGSGRPGRPSMGGGGGGGLFGGESSGGKLQSMIETKCNEPSTCSGVTSASLDCTFDFDEAPDLSSLSGMDESMKEDFKAQMEERWENMVKCACCGDMSIEDVLAAARPLGGGMGGFGGGSGRPGMGGFLGGFGGGEGMDIQEMLQKKCSEDEVQQTCAAMNNEAETPDCAKFDSMKEKFDSMKDKLSSMMDTNTRGGMKKNLMYCGCCRNNNIVGGGD